jgi:hypothetical protein
MPFAPNSWNVILLGAWNGAILTPEWIGKHVFEVPSGHAIAIEVPINTRGPWRVKQNDVAVLVTPNNLEFSCDATNFPTLEIAKKLASKTLDLLPVTPVAAAGFNLRFTSAELPPELAAITTSGLESSFSDNGFHILSQATRRTIPYKDGLINCEISVEENGNTLVALNFHRSSAVQQELKDWLSMPIAEVETISNKILACLKGVTLEQQQ